MWLLVGAATPPDVGESAGSVLSAGFSSVLSGIADLGVWLIPIGLVVWVVAVSISMMSRGLGPNPFQSRVLSKEQLERQARSKQFQRKLHKSGAAWSQRHDPIKVRGRR